MEYKFENIAFNSTAKKLPEDSDRQHYIGLEHLDSNSLYVSRWGSDVTPIGEKLLMKKGDILFGKRRAYQRKVGIAPFDGIFSAHGMVLRPKENIMDKDFFPFFIGSDQFMERAIRISVGGLSPTINWKDLKEQVFDIPSLDEQKSLATKLWAAYKLREEYKRLLAATDEMVKSQFIEMFGDNVSKKKISDVCVVRGGSTPKRTTKEFWDNGTISWFTVEDIYEQGRYISETKQHITELATKKCFVYPVNTVLICCTASVGEYAITKKEMASNQQFNGMMIKDKSELHSEYLLYVASTLKEDLLRQAGKTTINFVSRSKLEDIEIPVPPYSEQLGFVSVYQQADKSKFSGLKSQFIEMLSNSGYEEKSLGELCDKITDGSHNPPKGNDGSEYLMISSKNVFIDGLDLADVRYLSKEEFDLENKRTEVKKNNILLTIVGTIGRTYLVKGNEGNIVMQRSVAVLKPSDRVNPLFMMYSLHIDENLEKEGRGNAQKGVYLKQLSQFKIKVPSLDVQNNFCIIYQQADKSKQIAFSRAS